ncbi:MAG: hypothetical protein A2Y62_01855 [Candidatus Fischerbacteria bacterium RBG_13_37_8]|uniref:Glycosyltransferase subfamily 4-like N-terminal domain-containing protein n=1 Tax=Candidatus Fischerbacteria bacterium RBG_13_37_8 TaxID=1817863 RepID=A0A1F5VE77_9BACT|nr:MAG: hypothetical protein A2Y62_01855 [Candidatus Fischerbacteria bacterium RBG_13_37_8]
MALEKDFVKILYVENNIGIGGSIFSLLYLMQGLKEIYRVKACLIKNAAFYSLYKESNMEIIPINMECSLRTDHKARIVIIIKKFIHVIRLAKKFYTIFKTEKPRIVHVNNGLKLNRSEIIAAKLLRIPCVCHLRSMIH